MSAPELRFVGRWTTPMVYVQHPQAGPLCARLRELFLEREKDGERYRNRDRRDTQLGIFESRFDIHRWPDEPMQEAFRFMHTALVSTVRRLSGYTEEELARLRFDYHMWFHITRRGGYQSTHSHPNASWSGIFCVDPGDPPSEEQQFSGSVRFHDPRGAASMYQDPANERWEQGYWQGAITHWHQPGLLVMFPSFLPHEVFPYQGETPRIAIAFNSWCWLAPDDTTRPAR